jgi:hypothetical protein
MPAPATNHHERIARERKVRALVNRIDDECAWKGIDCRKHGFAIADMLELGRQGVAGPGRQRSRELASQGVTRADYRGVSRARVHRAKAGLVSHGRRCLCTVCTLANIYDGRTSTEDAGAQVEMALAHRRRADGIESILADTAGSTNHDRDARGL